MKITFITFYYIEILDIYGEHWKRLNWNIQIKNFYQEYCTFKKGIILYIYIYKIYEYYTLSLYHFKYISIFNMIMSKIISYNKSLELNLIKERGFATRKYTINNQ